VTKKQISSNMIRSIKRKHCASVRLALIARAVYNRGHETHLPLSAARRRAILIL
jgi:hypothetical protein